VKMEMRVMKILYVAVIAAVLAVSAASARPPGDAAAKPSVEKSTFGKLDDGTAVELYTLKNSTGATAKIITYGATLMELWVPDRGGKAGDIVLGFDNLKDYEGPHPHFGGIIGRVANRIAKGKFTLDGKQYTLAINNPPNTLHGGNVSFDHRVWKAESMSDAQAASVKLTYVSPDGEEGFPGNLTVTVVYSLIDGNALKLEYRATTDKPTILNLTNHSYFNFAGGGDVLKDILTINADSYTPVDSTMIPTGEIKPVKDTPLDFTKPTAIGARIEALKPDPGGYDHNFVLNGQSEELRFAARVSDPSNGRQMEVWTTEPGVQFYSAIHLDGKIVGKRGVAYPAFGAICLETEHFPDSINHLNFPSTVLRPGAQFHSETIYKFSAK
jgi:aldose 1-epimerase